MQLDLFRSPYHAVFVRRDGDKSPVMMFQNKDEMRRVAIYKLKKDVGQFAYALLQMTTDQKVITLERIYFNDKAVR